MNRDQVWELMHQAMSLDPKDPWVPSKYILALILFLTIVYLIDYLKKRGENRAIKEDVSRITHTVESINSTYVKELETLKAFLGTRSHFSKLRYERETEVYRELWIALVGLGEATQSLRPMLEIQDPNETDDQRKDKKAAVFFVKHHRLHEITSKNRPFYPSEVWQKLDAFLKLTQVEFLHYRLIDPRGGDPATVKEYLENAGKNQAEISERINDICEAIRHRLDKFDGPDLLA